MAADPVQTAISTLLNDNAQLASAFSNPASALAFVQKEAAAIGGAGSVANSTDLWPAQCLGKADRVILAGVPKIENAFHKPLAQGRLLESDLGASLAWIQGKKLDLDEKIQHYLSLNTLAIDGQLSDTPRAIKYANDAVKFVQQIRTYTTDITNLVSAIQANVSILLLSEKRMLGMIQANINALANLLNEICNWHLPSLPSLAVQLGARWHWNGFNFNAAAGFSLKSLEAQVSGLPNLGAITNFSFSQCIPRTSNFASVFGATPTSVADATLTVGTALPPPELDGSYGDPTQFTDPTYIATLQATTTPVFDPTKVAATNGTSLPTPASIISNYALPPATYQANIVSAVPVLAPAIIQPTDSDYGAATPSASRVSTLRGLSIRFITLAEIVLSNYDPNTTAAWLFYLNLNRAGRAGTWIANFEAAYTEYIAPSLAYLAETPVPWNEVLGGSGVSDAPAAIPLLTTIQGANAANILWKLSYIEAGLLGYARNTTWDSAADTTYLSGFTGDDVDYVPTTVNAVPTATVLLGADTAAYPVSCTYPQSISGVLTQVIDLAAANIAATPGFESTRPQFRYTYDMFAQASLVDRYTQFWREFNANLVALLADDPYLVSLTVTYPEALDSAIDPLGVPADFAALSGDASSRNRNWTPGVDLLPIPTATVLETSAGIPAATATGWMGNDFDPAAFLSRPDVQAQTIPTQIAMLRTNQSFASLMTLSGQITTAVATAAANANLMTQSSGLPGWEVETNTEIAVPPGAAGIVIGFGMVDFDQTGYVQTPTTISIQATNPYIVNAVLNWDPAGAAGTRTVMLTQNGTVIATASGTPDSPSPYTVQFSTQFSFTLGDTLEIVASHSLTEPQNLLTGSTFLGLLDNSSTPVDTAPISAQPAYTGTANYISGTTFPVYTALTQGLDGKVYPIDPTTKVPGVTPFLDGIALQASTEAGESVSVAVAYGTIFTATGQKWIEGGLLYIAADGSLTQDFATLTANVRWIICIGKAVTPTSFIYQPHIPTNYTLTY